MKDSALRLMCVLWPSFLAACALEMLVFGLVDPADLHWPVSRQLVYALAFFAFWVGAAASSALTLLLLRVPPPEPLEFRRTPSD